MMGSEFGIFLTLRLVGINADWTILVESQGDEERKAISLFAMMAKQAMVHLCLTVVRRVYGVYESLADPDGMWDVRQKYRYKSYFIFLLSQGYDGCDD